MPTVTDTFDAILFDMDGTLVDSTKGVIGAWHFFKQTYPHLDVEKLLHSKHRSLSYKRYSANFNLLAAHGVRTVDNLKWHCGVEDPEELEVSTVLIFTIMSISKRSCL